MGKRPHLTLPVIGEFSMHPVYKCPVCGEKLWTEKGARTKGEEWCFTEDGRRHYKNRCNLKGATDGH